MNPIGRDLEGSKGDDTQRCWEFRGSRAPGDARDGEEHGHDERRAEHGTPHGLSLP
jgi:hypothetical protein